jgi:hypothetical protein
MKLSASSISSHYEIAHLLVLIPDLVLDILRQEYQDTKLPEKSKKNSGVL